MNQVAALPATINPISEAIAAMLGNSIHIVAAHKGGVGKTPVAVALIEYAVYLGLIPKGFTLDAGNASLAKFFKTLGLDVEDASIVRVMSGNEVIDESLMNAFTEKLFELTRMCVIDVGSSGTCTTVRSFFKQYNLDGMLADASKTVYVHTVVGGGSDYEETAIGTALNAQAFADPRTRFVYWLNEFRGPVMSPNGRPFMETELFHGLKDRHIGTVNLTKQTPATEQQIVKAFTDSLSFSDRSGKGLDRLQAHTVEKFYRSIFSQLNQVTWK
jgi:hypothetical protein